MGGDEVVVYGVLLDESGSVDEYETRQEAEEWLALLGGVGVVRITQKLLGADIGKAST